MGRGDATEAWRHQLSVALCTHNLSIMERSAVRLHQQALHSGSFVAPLAGLRKQQFTQGEIAVLAGLSVPTVRLVERGSVRVIAGKLNVSREAVQDCLTRAAASRLLWPLASAALTDEALERLLSPQQGSGAPPT